MEATDNDIMQQAVIASAMTGDEIYAYLAGEMVLDPKVAEWASKSFSPGLAVPIMETDFDANGPQVMAMFFSKFKYKPKPPGLEGLIVQDPMSIFYYANYVIEGQWEFAEPFLLAHGIPQYIFDYTVRCRRKPWPEGRKMLDELAVTVSRYCLDKYDAWVSRYREGKYSKVQDRW